MLTIVYEDTKFISGWTIREDVCHTGSQIAMIIWLAANGYGIRNSADLTVLDLLQSGF
jgi:hypothetical protein